MVHELPFLFTEYEVFNLLMRNASPHYQKVSRVTLKKDCFTSYEVEKKKVFTLLKSANKVSVTTDIWKSSSQKQLKLPSSCTMWNATFYMLSATLHFKDVYPRYA